MKLVNGLGLNPREQISSILCNFIHKVRLVHVTKFFIYVESFTWCVKLYQIHNVTNERCFHPYDALSSLWNMCAQDNVHFLCVFFSYNFVLFLPED
jgi:hypothetical protein